MAAPRMLPDFHDEYTTEHILSYLYADDVISFTSTTRYISYMPTRSEIRALLEQLIEQTNPPIPILTDSE